MTRPSILLSTLLFASCNSNGTGGSHDMATQGSQDMATQGSQDMAKSQPDMATGMCDPFAQDCTDPNNPKCTVTQATPMAALTPMCVAATGMGKDGDTCMRTNMMVGIDDCAKGLFCSGLGTLQNPPSRHCRKFCNADTDCAAGSKCALLATTLTAGLCVPTCTEFGTDCTGGLNCDSFFADNDGATFFFSCRMDGSGAAGASCATNGDQDCVAGAICLDPAQNNMPKCYTLCDTTHTCTTGKCSPFVQGMAAGFCM